MEMEPFPVKQFTMGTALMTLILPAVSQQRFFTIRLPPPSQGSQQFPVQNTSPGSLGTWKWWLWISFIKYCQHQIMKSSSLCCVIMWIGFWPTTTFIYHYNSPPSHVTVFLGQKSYPLIRQSLEQSIVKAQFYNVSFRNMYGRYRLPALIVSD